MIILKRSSGILLHPTSLPGRYGIGDLGNAAYEFVDFLERAGQSLWQILPLNPTSFGDSPYQSFSTFAKNTLLLSPDLLAEDGLLHVADLNVTPGFPDARVDYGLVINYKNGLFAKAYNNFKESADESLAAELNNFSEANAGWLDDFSLFMALKQYFIEKRRDNKTARDYNKFAKTAKQYMTQNQIDDMYYGASWFTWPDDIARRDKAALAKWTEVLADEVGYHKFLQFLFDRQWSGLKEYANKKGIKIIGDIPIFVALDSADVWASPHLFELDSNGYPLSVAGVPPDYFSAEGQLWGNPLYDWQAHRKENYKWWANRIEHMLSCVDILRIDHFRGFESYWAVPYGETTAINGKWHKGPGEELFTAIREELGDLPIIAEDLGSLTDEVLQLRDNLGLPGMKVLQFAFEGGKGSEYMPHNFTTANAVIYSGTHDNDTSKGWYKNADERTRDYFRRYLNTSGDDVAWDMIRLAFKSSALYAIIPLQDVMQLGSEARMNTPGVSGGNWDWRFASDMLRDDYAKGLSYLGELANRIPPRSVADAQDV